jgi:hypothetical protein
MALPSPIPNREDNPTTNHQGVQQEADGKNRLHSLRAQRGRTMLNDPDLIDQGADGHGEKERLQRLQDEQTAGAKYGENSKSKLDLREYSSTGCEQSGNDRKHPCPLWIRSHGFLRSRVFETV